MGPIGSYWQVPHPLPHEQWAGGELLALRTWNLVTWAEEGTIRLQSITKGDLWHDPAFVADYTPEPDASCGSGVYAIKPSARPRLHEQHDWLTGRNAWIWGWVALSGRVIEHEKGYRAECAVIRRLRLGVRALLEWNTPKEQAELIRELEDRYACPVRIGSFERRKADRIRGFAAGLPNTPIGIALDVLPRVRPGTLPYHRAPHPILPAAIAPAPVRRRKRRKRPPVVTSPHGLLYESVVQAFQRAEHALGIKFQLRGRGHCGRVTLNGVYSRYVRPATRCWESFSPTGTFGARIIYPRAIVEHAARKLGVKPEILIGRDFS